MEFWVQIIGAIVVSALASSGLWAFVQKRMDRKDAKTRMLVGLAHDRIIYLGMTYIERGHITQDEYENLFTYLYEPYAAMGGNGSAKKVIEEVDKLPIHKG
jgi:hypothetical protein